jgi:miniconductance mechanosensitive channel
MKNWIGMVESGGRRVQKSINIDMTSVKFCDKALLDKLKKAPFLFDFFKSIHTEDLKQDSGSSEIQFTNLTLFKKYLENLIDTHPLIHQELTKMVRLLPSSERGLPVEITFFSKIQEAMGYEKLQSSVFDHVLAVIPEFDLRVFQNPSGNIFYTSANHQNVGNLVRNS